MVLLGHELWRRRFGGDPGIVGKTILANSTRYRVVGLMPPGFAFPMGNEAWIAVGPESPPGRARSVRRFLVMARLRPGVSLAAANEDLAAIGKRLAALYPADAGWTFRAVPWRRWQLGGDLQRSALAILAAVLSVLLIACANISSLLLAQAVKRRREMALRAALGAGPRRLARQVLTECLALAVAGGALGIALGLGGLSLLAGFLPQLPYGFALTPDPPALLAAFAVSLAVGLLFGIAPARRSASPDLRLAFQHAAVGDSRTGGRLHAGLIVAEVALSAVLLIAASLSLRTLSALRSEGRGTAPDHLLTVWTSFSAGRSWNPEERGDALRTVVERVAAVRGIESAAASNFIPLSIINGLPGWIEAEGAASGQDALCNAVSSGFFRTWGTPLVAGRDLTVEEGSTRSSAAVISATLARRLWPGEPPARAVGRRLRVTGAALPGALTVVGVAGDFKIESLREEAPSQVFIAATGTYAVLAVGVAESPSSSSTSPSSPAGCRPGKRSRSSPPKRCAGDEGPGEASEPRHGQALPVVLRPQVEQERRGALGPALGAGIAFGGLADGALQHAGVDDAGIQGDRREAGRQLLGEGAGETLDAPLGGAVGGHLGAAGAAPAGAEVDDDAVAALQHRGEEAAQDVRRPLEIDVDDAGEFLLGHLPEGRVGVDHAGVVDQQLDRGVARQDAAGPGLDLVRGGDVDDGKAVRLAELLLQLFERLAGAPAADHDVSEAGQAHRQRAPQAAGDAGDQDGAAAGAHGHAVSLKGASSGSSSAVG